MGEGLVILSYLLGVVVGLGNWAVLVSKLGEEG